jgi:DNA repair protein RadA/Sms
MAHKQATQFVCQQCGAAHSKWAGRCDNCGAWNSLIEQTVSAATNAVAASRGHSLQVQPITEVKASSAKGRLSTGMDDIDVVLGGGIVPASVVLIAGQPGIGKLPTTSALHVRCSM